MNTVVQLKIFSQGSASSDSKRGSKILFQLVLRFISECNSERINYYNRSKCAKVITKNCGCFFDSRYVPGSP